MRKHLHQVVHHAHRVVSHLRTRQILTRRKYLAVATLLNIAFIILIGLRTLSLPNTMVGPHNLGWKTTTSVRSFLTKTYTAPLILIINSQQYETTYEHIGVYLDPETALSEIYTPNKKPYLSALVQFATQLFHPRTTNIPLSFSQEFYEYIQKIDEAGAENQDIVYVDQNNKQATLFAPEQQYVVNTAAFQNTLSRHFGSVEIPIIVPLTKTPNMLQEKVTTANAKLQAVYSTPLTVIVGLNGTNRFIVLSPEDLRFYTKAHFSAESPEVEFSINSDVFLPDLAQALSVYAVSFNQKTAYDRVGNGIKNALATRFAGGPSESVKVGIDSGPNTEGDIAEKYIEIDISQQKMFTFKNGELYKSYRVSTGKDYPTPVGTFKILNKTGLGFSKIYNVWMPYWMGFEFSKELHAYFGIHELPYFYSGSNKIQRPREFIGAPNTGGCVALDIGDAKEVYQFADIGTQVVIYQ